MTDFASPFAVGDKVHIDSDASITATVTGITFRSSGFEVEVSWIVMGDLKAYWVAPFRLALARSAAEEDYPRLGAAR